MDTFCVCVCVCVCVVCVCVGVCVCVCDIGTNNSVITIKINKLHHLTPIHLIVSCTVTLYHEQAPSRCAHPKHVLHAPSQQYITQLFIVAP